MVKKIVKKPAKAVTKPAAAKKPMASETVVVTGCGCGCGCHGGGFWRFLKKACIFVIIFALGFAAAKLIPCNKMKGWMHRGDRGGHSEMFVNGCLDIAKIQCPEMAQKVLAADADANGCITKDEFVAFKQNAKPGCSKCAGDCDKSDCGCNKGAGEVKKDCGCNKRDM